MGEKKKNIEKNQKKKNNKKKSKFEQERQFAQNDAEQ